MRLRAFAYLAALAALGAVAIVPDAMRADTVNTVASDVPEGATAQIVAGIVRTKWNVGIFTTDALQTRLMVRVGFSPEGIPHEITLLGSWGPNQGAVDIAFRYARSAIMRSYLERAGGFDLPADRYHEWRKTDLVFDASGVRAG